MDPITLLGIMAGTCTTLAFLPQVIKVWQTRRTTDISLAMFLIFSSGVAMWLAYGLLIGDVPVILANLVTLVLAGIILGFKLRYK